MNFKANGDESELTRLEKRVKSYVLYAAKDEPNRAKNNKKQKNIRKQF